MSAVVAVPSAVAQLTVKVRALATVRLTVETTGVVPIFPSRTERLFTMLMVGAPSSSFLRAYRPLWPDGKRAEDGKGRGR